MMMHTLVSRHLLQDAFEFEISAGELPGPSKDGLVPDSEAGCHGADVERN